MTTLGTDPYTAPLRQIEPHWSQDALCAQTGPDLFFPDKGESPAQAKQVCTKCEVREQCLEAALRNKEPFGIWGGTTPKERRKILLGLAPHPEDPPAPIQSASHSASERTHRNDAIHRLADGGCGVRQIARDLDLNERTVHRVLARDHDSDQVARSA